MAKKQEERCFEMPENSPRENILRGEGSGEHRELQRKIKDVNAGSIENRHVELHSQGSPVGVTGVSAKGKEPRLSEDVR